MDQTTEVLASYAVDLGYADLTPGAIHEAKRRLIDSLGCAMGGYLSEPSKIARRLAALTSSTLPARVLGSGERTSPDLAAFANTVMVRYLDANDTYIRRSSGHTSDMIPAVLAVADALHAPGRDVLLGTTLAYEMYGALATVIPSLREKGWDQGLLVVVGSAVAAGKLLGLSREQMGHAISLAVTPNVPTRQTRAGELAMWKGCATAAATRAGVFAAFLAREGMTGPYEPFEGRHGLWEQVTGPFERPALREGSGPFAVEVSHLKLFPTEYHSQAPLSAILELRQKVKREDIEAIDVQTYWMTYSEIGSEPAKWDPRTRETADHSLPYLLAVALRDGAITPASFTAERICDPSLRPLMNKITIRENPEFTRQFPQALVSEIVLVTKSGERLVARTGYPKGHANNPMSDAEVEAKFLAFSQDVLTPRQCRSALDALWRLETAGDIGPVLDCFQV